MPKKPNESLTAKQISAQPYLHQRAREIQEYGTVTLFPLQLEEPVRLEMTEQLNQVAGGPGRIRTYNQQIMSLLL